MSGKGILQNQPSLIVDLEQLYETTVKELQRLLGNQDDHRWSPEDEVRIDDWLVQLCVWGSDLDIESGGLQKLREKEAVAVRSNLDLIRSSIAIVESQSALESGAISTGNVFDRLGLDVQNLCELSSALQMAIGLDQQKGPVFKVKEYMDLLGQTLDPPQPSNLKDAKWESSGAHPPLDTDTQNSEKGHSLDLLSILHRCQRQSASGEQFWPDRLLERIMTRDRVLESLDPYAQKSIDTIVPPKEKGPGLPGGGLVKIYALLLLLGKSEQISAFIEEGLLDKDLPLRYVGADFFCGKTALTCFQSWRPSEKSLFDSKQWGFAVPRLRLAPDGSPNHYNLDSRTIIPWAYDSTNPALGASGVNFGETSAVHRITIDPDSQELWEPLHEMGLDDTFFALRIPFPEYADMYTFSEELNQLRMLTKTRHKHLVTLLASISYNGSDCFLFPYAECDLLQFWKDWHPEPQPKDMKETRWLIRQLSGLVGAIETVHTQRDYHGDICPQQIHCFKSSHDPRGIVVLSSYGIPSRHSGSIIPRYQRLMENSRGNTLSREYDVWSLGLVFLEFITWFLGGRWLVYEFEEYMTEGHTQDISMFEAGESTGRGWAPMEERLWPNFNSDETDMGWTRRANSSSPAVNREVTYWLQKLVHHGNCTSFIRDILLIIERRILSVAPSGIDEKYFSKLQREFSSVYRECGGDINAFPSPSGPASSRHEASPAPAESSRQGRRRIVPRGEAIRQRWTS